MSAIHPRRRRQAAGAAATLGALAGIGLLAVASAADEHERSDLRAALASTTAATAQLVAQDPAPAPGGGTIRRFVQRVDGLPVHGAEAVVVELPTGEAELVVDHTVPRLSPTPAAKLDSTAAVRNARAATAAGLLRAKPHARLGVDPATGRPAWEVRLAVRRPLADLLVSVDAVSGRVLGSRDLLRRGKASASLFDPNPVVTRGTSRGLRDAKDRRSSRLASLRVPVVLERLTSRKGCLRGKYADARLGAQAKRVCRRSRSWRDVGRARGNFEALMGYFHIDRTRAYVASLKLTKGLRGKPQRIRANAFAHDNSYYSPFERVIVLGTGGVDDGEDADVIVHEYGHSLQDQQRPFFGTTLQGAAIGEGFGDYLAAAISSLTTGGQERFDACMFEWDAISYTDRRCARRADKDITLRRASRRCGREPHCVGEAWSGALLDLRTALGVDPKGRSIGDRIVLQSQFMYTRRTKFRDAARALIAADKLLYDGAHTNAVEGEMVERRFCPQRGC